MQGSPSPSPKTLYPRSRSFGTRASAQTFVTPSLWLAPPHVNLWIKPLYRRHRGDMIEVFKYLRGMYSVRSTEFLPRAPKTALRGHDYKLMKRHCRSHARLSLFSVRVATLWNNLPNDVVSAPSLNSFKGRLDKYWETVVTPLSNQYLSSPLIPANLYREASEQPTGHIGLTRRLKGLTENAGHENDGPSKLQDMKLQDMKLTDQFSRNLQGMKLQDMKMTDQMCRA